MILFLLLLLFFLNKIIYYQISGDLENGRKVVQIAKNDKYFY